MFGFTKTAKTTTRRFDSSDLDELVAGIEAGRFIPSYDTIEILGGLEAGSFTREMAIAMFRQPFDVLAR